METPQAIAAEKAGWELGSRRSVEVRVKVKPSDQRPESSGRTDYDSMTEHYIETASGRRYYEVVGLKDGVRVSRSAHYADGKRCADVDFDRDDLDKQNLVLVNRQFWLEDRSDRRQVPQPLLYLHVGRARLDEALPKAQHLGRDEVLGRDCEVFLFPKVRWAVPQDQVFSLDADTSIPLKVESFLDEAARKARTPASVWTATSVETVQGRLVPMTSRFASYGPDGALRLSSEYVVESIEFDGDYPASTFWPTIQPGVSVLDSIARTDTTTPGGEPRAEPGALVPATPAELPATTADGASYAAIILGAALLLAGLVLWRRQASG